MKKLKKALIVFMAMLFLVPTMAMANGDTTVKTPAGDLRSTLDQLLSEHYVLATTYMMKAYDDAPDTEEVWNKLDQNAADMTPAIASVYGDEAAAQFEEIFRHHNDYAPDFVEAAKNDDQELRESAQKEVDEFVNEFASFLATATEDNLPEGAAKEAIAAHEQDVLDVFDHYVHEEYEEAYTDFREGFHRMFDISKALSNGIVTQMPEQFENTKADAPTADLRSDLNALASEHFALAVLEMQKGFNQSADYDFVTWAEDQHTTDFKAAIASIYGEDGAAQFEQVWQQNHIDAQADIVTAAIENDEEARQAAEESLKMFSSDFGEFLGTATEGNLPAEAATEAVWGHEEQVLATFDHYVAGEYTESYDSFREGYAYMFGIGETLGDAIVKQMPEQFSQDEAMPEAMPETGFGGASDQGLSTKVWMVFGFIALASAGLLYTRKSNA